MGPAALPVFSSSAEKAVGRHEPALGVSGTGAFSSWVQAGRVMIISVPTSSRLKNVIFPIMMATMDLGDCKPQTRAALGPGCQSCRLDVNFSNTDACAAAWIPVPKSRIEDAQ